MGTWVLRITTTDYRVFETIMSAVSMYDLRDDIIKHGITIANEWYPASRIDSIELVQELI